MTTIKKILEGRKELSDKQKLHIDKNDNGEIDSQDFKAIHAKRDDVYTSDYKLDKNGRKTKAHKISFKTGEHEVKGESFKPMDEPKYSLSIQARQKEADKNMTNKQNKKHEDIAKGMKKSYKGFVQAYGKNRAGMDEEVEQIEEAIHADDYTATSEKSQFGGHRPHVVNKETGKTMHLSAAAYKSPEHAKAHAKAYLTGYAKMGMHAADRASIDYAKANKEHMVKEDINMNEELHPEAHKVLKHIKPEHHAKYTPDMTKKHYTGTFADRKAVLDAAEKAGHLKEASPFDWKNTPRQTSDKTQTSTFHDVKKISTGTVYTKQFDKDGTSKGTGDDAAKKAEGAAKRGRGRPKKDKFSEAVEFLIKFDEETFDSLMEEGFDSFMEQYEQLDELSKKTLGNYAKKASRDSTITRKIGADFENQAKKARSPGMKAASTSLADKYKAKSWKRRDGVDQAINKLTK